MNVLIFFKKNKTRSQLLPFFLILFVVGICFLRYLGRDQLWDWDECLYGQYAKEMPLAKHYLTNIWNGYIDMQKPPLYTWLLTFSRSIFGPSEFSLRLISVISSLGIMSSVFYITRRYFSLLSAYLSLGILLVSELFVVYSLHLNTDIVFTLVIFWAVFTWYENVQQLHKKSENSWKRFLPYISGLLFGIATMLKGIGSIQFIVALCVTFLLWPSKKLFLDYIKMGFTFSGVVLPWHIAAYLQYGEKFLRIYFYENIVKRGSYPIEFHRERWYFYFVLLFRELKPWIVFGIITPLLLMKRFVSDVLMNKFNVKSIFKNIQKILTEHKKELFLLIMILVPLSSLVRFQTRIAWYVLPLYPFIAIFLAVNIEKLVLWISQLNVLSKKAIYVKIVLLIFIFGFFTYESSILLAHEVKPEKTLREYSMRELAILEVKKQQQDTLEYLVPSGERIAKEILPPTEQLDMTWVFGGHPCAVYYSKKKVNYYYTTDEFMKVLGQKGKLYLIPKPDLLLLGGNSYKIIYSNAEFELVTLE